MTRRSVLLAGGSALVSNLFSRTPVAIAPAANASFVLEVEKTGLMAGKKHRFLFTDYHGEVSDAVSGDHTQQVTFTVRSGSIRCEDTWVNDKDRAKILKYALNDMLKADQYPEIRYVSSAIHAAGGNRYSIEGNLTIGARTRNVTVNATQEGNGAAKQWWSGSAVIALTGFGLKPPSAGLGTVGTKDEMRLLFHLVLL